MVKKRHRSIIQNESLYVIVFGGQSVRGITMACSMGTIFSLWICLMLLAWPFSAFPRAPRGWKRVTEKKL